MNSLLIFIISNQNISFSQEPDKFIELIVNEASTILAENENKEKPVQEVAEHR